VWTVDVQRLVDQLRHTRWEWAGAAAALGLLGLWARARRWHFLFPPGSEPPGLLAAMLIGYMANNILPLRAGELVRVYVVARRWGHGFWTVLATAVVERMLDGLAIVLLLGLLLPAIPVPPLFKWAAAVLLAVNVVGLAALVALGLAPDRARRLAAACTRRWPRVQRHTLAVVETSLRGLEGVRTLAHALPLVLWTPVIWLCPAAAAWAALRAVNLDLPWVAGVTVLAFVGLGVSVPSAPGYVGVFHAAAVLALAVFGVSSSEALGYAIVFHASQLVPITLVGWVALVREHVSLGEATRARVAFDVGGSAAASRSDVGGSGGAPATPSHRVPRGEETLGAGAKAAGEPE
jgi:uncharacterized protein (TIRG00374 family)